MKKKIKIIIVVFIVVFLILTIGTYFYVKNYLPEMIAQSQYVDPLEDYDLEEDAYLTFEVGKGKDIEPGLYSLDISTMVSELFQKDALSKLGVSTPITIHKDKLNYDFNIKMVSGNSYKNIKLEEGDYIKFYDNNKLVLDPNVQDKIETYNADNLQSGFYVVGQNIQTDYESSSFSSSSNTLFRKKGNTYVPRPFYPVSDLEKEVKLHEGDVIYIEENSILNSNVGSSEN